MTAAVDETEKVREAVASIPNYKQQQQQQQQQLQYSKNIRNIRRFHQQRKEKSDEREGRSRRASTSTTRRDRIAPDPEMFLRRDKKHEGDDRQQQQHRRRSSKSKRQLQIETSTKAVDDLYPDVAAASTPRTEASTPSSSSSPAPPLTRDNSDLRSPGARKSPVVAKIASATPPSNDDNTPLPDFITQTDRYGNASTPRSAEAVQKARELHPTGAQPKLHIDKDGKLTELDGEGRKKQQQQDVDACTETLLDSFRIMCCCFLSDSDDEDEEAGGKAKASKQKIKKTATEPDESSVRESDENRPSSSLLPKLHPDDHGKKCLVLDLDETLVHSSFRAVPGADFVIPVQIEDVVHFVYVMKRPGVDEFLVEMAKHYEIVLYTASLNKYADPLLDLLDPQRVMRARLFRESCVYYEGNYVKDLSLLDRDLSQAIIVDNSPSSYIFHPENAIDCSSFIDDPDDRELDQIAAFLKGVKDAKDVRGLCRKWREWPR